MKKRSYKDKPLIIDQCFTDSFDRMDLIEARVREVMFTAELATHLTKLGIEARATIVSLNKDPVVSVYGFHLTADEASDLIRRFDPKWDGQAYERNWEGVMNDASLEKLEEDQKQKEEPEQLRQQSSPPKPEPKKTPPRKSRRLGGFPRRVHRR